ncbi:hypothetical protein [Ligilactobacillus saerimneri]
MVIEDIRHEGNKIVCDTVDFFGNKETHTVFGEAHIEAIKMLIAESEKKEKPQIFKDERV